MGMSLLNQTATIDHPAYQKDADGSLSTTTSSGITSYPCSLQAKSTAETFEYQRQYGVEVFDLFLPYSQGGSAVSVAHGDTINVGGVGYKVRGPAIDVGGRGLYLRVNVELVK